MKAFKIVLLVILSILDAYSLYSTIGYTILGGESPRLVGNVTTVSMGMYILAIVFLLLTIVLSVFIVVIAKKLKKTK